MTEKTQEGTTAPIPLGVLIPSKTDVQARRRKRFTPESLGELAATMKSDGQMQAILARPIGKKLEIVAGERRYLAAQIAGLPTLDVTVREMTDQQVLRAQLIENLQRKEFDPIDEATGYAELMKLEKKSADEIAAMIGKSRSHVYGRLKLLDLNEDSIKLVQSGKLDATTAQIVARIPVPALRAQAAQQLAKAEQSITHRQAIQFIAKEYMLELKGAPFALDEKGLGGYPDCKACPKRTGNARELYPETEVKNPDICTDPACFRAKREAFYSRQTEAERKKGSTILSVKEGERLFHETYSGAVRSDSSKYVVADEEEHIGEKYRTWRSALGKDAPTPATFVQLAGGRLVELYVKDEAVKILRAKGVISGATRSDGSSRPKAEKDREARERLERTYRQKLFDAVHATPIVFDRDVIVMIATAQWSRLWGDYRKPIHTLYGWQDHRSRGKETDVEAEIARMDLSQLARFMLDLTLVADIGPHGDAKDLLAVAAKLKIPATAIRNKLVAEKKEKDQATAKRLREKKAKAAKKAPAGKAAA